VDSRGLKLRFQFLTAGLSKRDLYLLGALALEWELTNGQFSALKSAGIDRKPGVNLPLHPLLSTWVASGLAYRSDSSQRPRRRALFEPVYGVNPEYRQLILRHLSQTGELDEVALETHRAMEGRTVAPLFVALQQGDLGAFDRFVSALRTQDSSLGGNVFVEALRESVCQPFDASWFEQVWGKRTIEVAARVLRDGAWSLRPVDGLYQWAETAAGAEGNLTAGHGPILGIALAEQGVMRGRPEDAEQHIDAIPELYRGWYRAAARFAAGDAQEAHEWLRKQVSVELTLERRSSGDNTLRPELDAAHAICALLLIGRDESEGVGLVKRLASARYVDERSQRLARALKTLLRYHAHSEQEVARIDIHQLDTEGCAWELIILALVVQMYQQGEWSRANWGRVLAERGLLWLDAGFIWVARQTLFLGRVLSEQHFDERYKDLVGAQGEPLALRPGEILISDLLTPKPEWAKQLDALDELVVVEEVEEFGVASASRVVWYIDMVRGELNKPALQELTAGGGWSSGRRVTADELLDVVEQLPEEDAVVVHRSVPGVDGERTWPPEALELLVGHLRVFNAAKKRQAVQVVLGQARVETREERGQVELFVEPKGLTTGLNVHTDGETRITVYRVTPQTARLIQQIDQGIRVPANETARLRAVLGKISQVMEVRSSHLGDVERVVPDSRVVLRISPVGGAWVVQAGVKPFSERGSFYVTAFGRRELSILHRGRRLRCDRDFDAEKAALTQLLLICPALARARAEALEEDDNFQQEQRWTFGEEGLLVLLAELRDAQADVRLEWPESTALRLRGTGGRSGISVKLRRNKGWYLATGGLKVDDLEEWSLDQLMAMPATSSGRFVRLPNGDYIEVEQRVRRVMDALRAAGEPRGGKPNELNIHESALTTLETLAASSDVEIDDSLTEWLARVARVRDMDWPVPAELQGTLRGYQHEGFRWLSCLSELGLGACLADDMGLGKTVQLLALLLRRQSAGPILVVAPTSVCSNWINEAKRFAPALRSLEYVGSSRAAALRGVGPGTLLICSYGLLQQDVEALSAVKWGTAVLDEAQFIKNPESLRAKAAYRLDAEFRVISTGTPVENHLGDLWSIFHFLNPDLFGTWKGFQRRFVRTIERENDQRAKQELRELVKPYVLRRTKSQVLDDLPPLTAVRHEVRLSEVESQQYAVLRKQIWEKLHNASVRRYNKLEILAEITRLRRFCCHPRLVFPEAELDSSKIDAFIELVEELRENGHQALVFSQFVDFLSLVRGHLDDRAIPYLYLDGSTSRAARAERVAEFQRGECPLFLISLKAGGFGLNLTAADYVIHLDPWWNPAVEAQATDRAHRIGQQRPVTVYRLVTKDTIEERILSLHEEKKAIAAAVLDSDDATSVIPVEQLLDLIAAQ
jgi:hypothetical protein